MTQEGGSWGRLVEPILDMVFSHLRAGEVLNCGLVCRHWYNASRDNMLWKRLFNRQFKPLKSNGDPLCDTWLEEYARLCDRVPCVECHQLDGHTDEVLHASFSHDGRQVASCSKDNRIIVWSADTCSGSYSLHFARLMDGLSWKHTWAAQYSPDDARLMVAGVTSTIGGEVAIFETGRGRGERYVFLCRVVNDPYDVLGCWITERHFLSGTFSTDFQGDLQVLIWVCEAPDVPDSTEQPANQAPLGDVGSNLLNLHAAIGNGHSPEPLSEPPLTLTCYKGIAFKFRSFGGNYYMRYLQSHSRKKFLRRRRSSNSSDLETFDPANWTRSSSEAMGAGGEAAQPDLEDDPGGHQVGLPDLEELSAEDARRLEEQAQCMVFLCGEQTSIPHQLGFQRLRASELNRPPKTLTSPEKIIDFKGHVIGMSTSPDERRLFVNVRAWPDGAAPSREQPPPISTAIDMHEVDLETLAATGRVFRGHRGFTPTETAFYLYSDVSADLVTSGSESCRGCIWERRHGCLVAELPHEACVNAVAICPSDQELCVTASDDHTMKVWKSRRKARQS